MRLILSERRRLLRDIRTILKMHSSKWWGGLRCSGERAVTQNAFGMEENTSIIVTTFKNFVNFLKKKIPIFLVVMRTEF